MKNGFTLIELIVAASIIVLLVSIAVPRYNKFSLQQEFNRSAQSLVGCMQRAQQAAAAPSQFQTGVPAFALSTIQSLYGKVDCTIDVYPSGSTFATDGSYKDSGASISSFTIPSVANIALCSTQSSAFASSTPVSAPSVVRVRFDASNRGLPISVNADSTAGIAGVGSGAEVTMIFVPYNGTDVATSCSSPITKATLKMSRLGVPIQLCTTYGTSCI